MESHSHTDTHALAQARIYMHSVSEYSGRIRVGEFFVCVALADIIICTTHMYEHLSVIKWHIQPGVSRFSVCYFIMFALRIYFHPLILKSIYVPLI